MYFSQTIDLLDSDMHNPCCLLHRVYAALDGAKKGEPGKSAALLGMLAAGHLAKWLGSPPTAASGVPATPTEAAVASAMTMATQAAAAAAAALAVL
jgi:hypothetical protein